MKVLDLFSGIGGFSLGLELAGRQYNGYFITIAFCEANRQCQGVLRRHWPGKPIYPLIETLHDNLKANNITRVDIITGGDPCPCRSRARSIHGTKHPDLSGYFLALAGRFRPRWVVRENVPAPDDIHFTTALEYLGYRTVVVSSNSYPVTAQNRCRDFIVGCDKTRFSRFIKSLKRQSGDWLDTKGNKKAEGYPCLTTHRKRYDSRDGYIWDGTRLRVADKDERTKLAGFPPRWLDGLSETACARMTGNAVVPQIVEIIGRAIIGAELRPQ